MNEIRIDKEPIELFKLLKFASLASSGGEAKLLIAEGLVRVNGELESRKRRKLVDGDIVALNGEKMKIILS